jgi:excisionase family DNA binding protein
MSPVSCVDASIPAENSPNPTLFHNAISCDIPTACKLSGISRSYLYLVLARGDIRSIKAGRRRLVLVASLRTWLQSLPTGGLAITRASTERI